MADRPVHRYTDDELATIRARLAARDDNWIDAVWDPILLDAHGVTLAEAGEQGMKIKVGEYGIPWAQSMRISRWARPYYSADWLSVGPTPVQDEDR